MARNPKPRGSVVRTPPDWFANNLMGAWASNGPCAGNLTSVFLYNNATDGSVLRVYGLNLAVGASTQVFFKTYQGNAGNLVTGIGAPGPIDPRNPLQPGVLYTLAQATAKGIGAGGLTILVNTVVDLEYNRPIALIPPSWSFAVEPNTANVQLFAGFRWLAAFD